MKEQHSALTRSTQAMSRETRTQDLLAESLAGNQRRILWIDGVGGFLLIDCDEVVVGQAISGGSADICIVGDLSREAAVIRRNQGDYLLQPLQPTMLDGRPVERAQLLQSGASIQFGDRVKLSFRMPNPLSATARIDLASLHRFKPNVDGILLLSDSCILGPAEASHVKCPTWSKELLLFRHGNGWCFRTSENVEVDGNSLQGQIPMIGGMRMKGDDFSLSIE